MNENLQGFKRKKAPSCSLLIFTRPILNVYLYVKYNVFLFFPEQNCQFNKNSSMLVVLTLRQITRYNVISDWPKFLCFKIPRGSLALRCFPT